jgi:hypothetical protein
MDIDIDIDIDIDTVIIPHYYIIGCIYEFYEWCAADDV